MLKMQVFYIFACVERDPSRNPDARDVTMSHFTKGKPEALRCFPKVTW